MRASKAAYHIHHIHKWLSARSRPQNATSPAFRHHALLPPEEIRAGATPRPHRLSITPPLPFPPIPHHTITATRGNRKRAACFFPVGHWTRVGEGRGVDWNRLSVCHFSHITLSSHRTPRLHSPTIPTGAKHGSPRRATGCSVWAPRWRFGADSTK